MMKKLLFFISICFLISFTACSKKSYSDVSYSRSKSLSADISGAGFNDSFEFKESLAEEPANFSDNNQKQDTSAANIQRKLIKNGSVSLEVESLSQTDAQIQVWLKSYNGYILNSSINDKNSYYTIRIPQNKFEEAMNATGNLGKILHNDIYSNDVTEEYYDTESRLNTKKILQKKYEDYLSRAKDVKELLQIERELNNVISEIESMEGRLKRLDSLIDYSTITINCTLPSGKTETGIIKPDLKNTFRAFGSIVLSFFAKLLFIIIGIIVFGAPISALIILFYWLLFGKVGIIRRIIKKSQPEKKE